METTWGRFQEYVESDGGDCLKLSLKIDVNFYACFCTYIDIKTANIILSH